MPHPFADFLLVPALLAVVTGCLRKVKTIRHVAHTHTINKRTWVYPEIRSPSWCHRSFTHIPKQKPGLAAEEDNGDDIEAEPIFGFRIISIFVYIDDMIVRFLIPWVTHTDEPRWPATPHRPSLTICSPIHRLQRLQGWIGDGGDNAFFLKELRLRVASV